MGFLQIAASEFTPGLGDFSTAIISVWFRVPATVLAAVAAQSDPDPSVAVGDGYQDSYFSPPLSKIIPLITFGSLEETLASSGEGGFPCSPSFIGIDCNFHITGKSQPTLAVNLQTASTCSFNKSPVNPQNEIRPEAYYMRGFGSRPYTGADPQNTYIAGDKWHHALISFDLSSGCSVTWANANRSPPDAAWAISPGPIFSWALDDVGKVGCSMQPAGGSNWANNPAITDRALATPIADNYIIPQAFFEYFPSAGDIFSVPIETSTDFIISTSGGISAASKSVGMPASAEFVDNVYLLEMAELQFFTGVTCDATDVDIRRLFVTADGKPADINAATEFFGQAPDIQIAGQSQNWIDGHNSGVGGQFSVVGTITTYANSPGL